MAAWVAGLVARASPAGAVSPPETTEAPAPRSFELALVAVRGIDRDEFVDDLSLRTVFAQGIQTQWKLTEIEQTQGRVFVFAEAVADQPVVVLRVITDDGHLYRREIEAGAEDVRVVASVTASLLLAVAQGELEPEREGVALPESESEASVKAAVAEPESEGEPPPDATVDPAEPGEGDLAREDPVVAEDPPSWDRHFLLTLGGGPKLGLWPAYGGVLAGGGIAIDLGYRAARGWIVGGGLTGEGRRNAGTTAGTTTRPVSVVMTRYRLHATAGYAPVWGRLMLPVRGGPVVEVTSLRAGGDPARLAERDGTPWLFGGIVTVEPMYRLPGAHERATRGRVLLALGLVAELGYTVAADGRPVTVNAGPSGQGSELVRTGGFELATRLAFSVAWGL